MYNTDPADDIDLKVYQMVRNFMDLLILLRYLFKDHNVIFFSKIRMFYL